MMKKFKFFAFAAVLMMAAACSEPLEEAADESTPQNEAVATTTDCRTVADVNMERFAEILSKAVAQNREVRAFFKSEAQQKIDNDYNVFYPISKCKAVGEVPLEQVLAKYADETELAEIQAAVPLLNIHLPELAGSTVAALDPDDDELPVLYNNVMYYDGEPVDTLAADEVPGFNILVVTESSSIRKKSGLSKSASDLALDDEYEYVDVAYKPNKSLLKFQEYDVDNYRDYGTAIEARYLDPVLIQAFKRAGNDKEATRCFMYYDISNLKQTPTKFNHYVCDYIYRFQINAQRYGAVKLTTAGGDANKNPFFYGSTTNEINQLSRTEALNRLLKGQSVEIIFDIYNVSASNPSFCDEKTLSVRVNRLFNVHVQEEKRHKTAFRHTKYTYTINENGFKSKWYYPHIHGQHLKFAEWDITQNSTVRKVVVWVKHPNAGKTYTMDVEYKKTQVKGGGVNGTINAAWANVIGIIEGKYDNRTTTEVKATTQIKVTETNLEIAQFDIDFFNDYPLSSEDGYLYWENNKLYYPNSVGEGDFTMDVLPVTTEYYNRHVEYR